MKELESVMNVKFKHTWNLESIMDSDGKRSGDWRMNIEIPIFISNAPDQEMEVYLHRLKHAMDIGFLNLVDILSFVEQYPNDKKLGERVRSFISDLTNEIENLKKEI